MCPCFMAYTFKMNKEGWVGWWLSSQAGSWRGGRGIVLIGEIGGDVVEKALGRDEWAFWWLAKGRGSPFPPISLWSGGWCRGLWVWTWGYWIRLLISPLVCTFCSILNSINKILRKVSSMYRRRANYLTLVISRMISSTKARKDKWRIKKSWSLII